MATHSRGIEGDDGGVGQQRRDRGEQLLRAVRPSPSAFVVLPRQPAHAYRCVRDPQLCVSDQISFAASSEAHPKTMDMRCRPLQQSAAATDAENTALSTGCHARAITGLVVTPPPWKRRSLRSLGSPRMRVHVISASPKTLTPASSDALQGVQSLTTKGFDQKPATVGPGHSHNTHARPPALETEEFALLR